MLRKLRERSKNFKVLQRLSQVWQELDYDFLSQKKPKVANLVKSKNIPAKNYLLCDQPELSKAIFLKLSNWFQAESMRHPIDSPEKFFFEKGHLGNDQAYFFIKKPYEKGFLFYVNEIGWQVFLANKIVASETFVRSAMLFDTVSIHIDVDRDIAKARLSSERFLGPDHAPFEIYRKRLYQLLLQTQVS